MSARDPFGQRICRGCGCTEHNACLVETPEGLHGCSWVMLDIITPMPTGLCSACAIELEWDQRAMREVFTLDDLTVRSITPPQLVRAS